MATALPPERDEPPPPATPRPPGGSGALAAQQLRLLSALVLLLGLGLFLALPFVLSTGAVVFLPLTTAVVLFILLSPVADRMTGWGLPNMLASLLALVGLIAAIGLALTLILQPAIALFDELPQLAAQVGARFAELREQVSWIAEANDRIAEALGRAGGNRVVIATPSMIEQVAVATPTVLVEVLLTFLMAFFMLEARVRLRRRLAYDRDSLGTSLRAVRAMREVQDRVAAYIATVATINAGAGALVAAGAWALGMPAPIMWGGLAAILNFLPYIGPLMMTALLALFGVGTSETVLLGLLPAAAYLALHAVEANVVTPSVLGARFTLNPVMILLALSYFTWIWGFVGALLSVPLLLMVTAFIDHVGRPNLVGFLFGEPLFERNMLALRDAWPEGADDAARPAVR